MQPQTYSPPVKSFLCPKVFSHKETVSSGVFPPTAKNSAIFPYLSKIHFKSVRLSSKLLKPTCPSNFPNSSSSFNRIEAIVHSSSRCVRGLTPSSTLFLFTAAQSSGPPQETCELTVFDGTLVGTNVGVGLTLYRLCFSIKSSRKLDISPSVSFLTIFY